jgi:hypothetical protein
MSVYGLAEDDNDLALDISMCLRKNLTKQLTSTRATSDSFKDNVLKWAVVPYLSSNTEISSRESKRPT